MKKNHLKSVSDFQSHSPKGNVSSATTHSYPRLLLLISDKELSERLEKPLSECFHVTFQENPVSMNDSVYLFYDAVIIDKTVNGMSGDQLCFLIKSDKNIVHIPVVLLAEECYNENYPSHLGCGADHVEARSIDIYKLKTEMKMLVDNDKSLKKWMKEFKATDTTPDKTEMEDKTVLFKRKVDALIKENLTETDFSIAKLASEMCMSHSNFCRIMKMYFHITPEQYVMQYKMKEAETLLTTTQKAITEIAYEVGFSSLKYFGKKFKKCHGGKSPTEFRNNPVE